MDTHPRYTLVGIVVVIILFALGFWVSWLWRADSSDSKAFYYIFFNNQSLSGLQTESLVTMRGIKVGNVKSVEIDSRNIERVRVTVAIKQDTPIRIDTRAIINRNLLTGLASIDLVGSTQSAKPLILPPAGEKWPVIEEGKTGLEQVQQSVPELIGKASAVLDRLSMLLSDQNIQSITSTLSNFEKGSAAIEDLGPVMKSADRAFNSISAVLNETSGKVGPAFMELEKAIREIRQISVQLSLELKSLISSARLASDKLKDPRSSVLGLPSGKLGPGETR